jgi:hypothetical protein
MRKMILIAALCLIALSLAGMPMAIAQNGNVLDSYTGNLSQKELGISNVIGTFGQEGLNIAEAVKFTAPKADWKLQEVDILGWDGFNGTVQSVPQDRVIAVEVRDKDLNLLYRFADSQRAYTNFAFNRTIPTFMNIELPPTPVSGDFYICFYDRGAVGVMSEPLNTTNNSYYFNKAGKEIVPAELSVSENQTVPVNWIMSVNGS